MFGLRTFRAVGAFVLVVVVCITGLQVNAQSASEILINYVEAVEAEDGLELTAFFTLVNSSGQADPRATVRSASLLIDEGNPTRYDATIDKPDTPLYITLVLDASGSMLGAANDMRAAAVQAVNDAPPQAQFAVIGFNDEISLLTDGFSSDKQAIVDAIQQVQPINNRGTCLYDATYQAVELLAEAAPLGRRAAIVFTDGIDEVANTAGPCSTHTSGEVIDLASRRDLRVPIHTIGMRSAGQVRINEVDLRNIAATTGGLSAIGGQADLGELFGAIMAAIGSQQRVTAVTHPAEGLRTLTLLLTLSDGTPLRGVVTFTSPNDYSLALTTPTPDLTATPLPVELDILGVRPVVEERIIVIQTNVENEESVSSYRVELKNASTNTLQGDGFIVQPPLPTSVSLEVGGLQGGPYEIVVRALDAGGRVIASSGAERFTYPLPTPTPSPTVPTSTPMPVGARIQSVQHNPGEGVLRIFLSIYRSDEVAQLRIELFDQTTRQLIGTPHFSEPEQVAEVDARDLIGGQYEVVVVSVDDAGSELARDTYQFSVMAATPTPMPSATPTVATNTPPPVGPDVHSVQHDPNENVFRVNMSFAGSEQIAQLRIELFDQATHQLIGAPAFAEPAETLTVAATGVSDGSYEIVIVALDTTGAELGRDAYPFSVRLPVATPTPSPVPVSAEIGFPSVDDATLELIFPVSAQNEERIAQYVLEFIDQDNILANSYSYPEPPYTELRVPLTDGRIVEGQYVVQLRSLDQNGIEVSKSTLPPVRIDPPDPPAEDVSSAGPATPASFPSLQWARENQYIALGVIGGLIALILIALVLVMRRSKSPAGAQYWEELSSAQEIPEFNPNYESDSVEIDPYATNPVVQIDPDATNPIPRLLLPEARLVVERTRVASLIGQSIPISHVPFKIGRRGRGDVNFDEDDNISREHAVINFEDSRFTITDLGSLHGTMINGERIANNIAVPLKNGDRIRLGITTQVMFETEA